MMEAWRVAEMIDALPERVYDPALPSLVQQACLECFFVHVRALIEFLQVRPRKPQDFGAEDLVVGALRAPSGVIQQQLQAHWETASRHVMHFSRARVKQDGVPTEQVSVGLPALREIADCVLAEWDRYAVAVSHAMSPPRTEFGYLFS